MALKLRARQFLQFIKAVARPSNAWPGRRSYYNRSPTLFSNVKREPAANSELTLLSILGPERDNPCACESPSCWLAGNMRVCILVLLLLVASTLHAERLPLKSYTVADGLPNNIINKIVRDSHGFLWFCTNEGLARFDGYSFTTYGVDQGLPHAIVNDFLETRNGEIWIATNGGLVFF